MERNRGRRAGCRRSRSERSSFASDLGYRVFWKSRPDPAMSAPHIAALFWFYKEPEISANHLEMFRRHNEGLSVYGLYGGRPDEAAAYEARLGPLPHGFFVGPPPHPGWKMP